MRVPNPISIVRRQIRKVRWFIQRGRRGWADCDWWDLYSYVASIVSQMMVELHDHGHGYWSPTMSFANSDDAEHTAWWNATLAKIAVEFSRLADDSDTLDDPDTQDAIHTFAEHFGTWWD